MTLKIKNRVMSKKVRILQNLLRQPTGSNWVIKLRKAENMKKH